MNKAAATDETTRVNPATSMQGRLLAIAMLCFVVALAIAIALYERTSSAVLAVSVGLLVAIPAFGWAVRRALEPTRARIRALVDSADSLRDADFSFTIADHRDDEVGRLVRAYNRMVGTLRDERQNLHQRELMLDTVLQASPLALVLTNDNGHIIYANATARALFTAGRRMAGMHFLDDVVSDHSDSLKTALVQGVDAMVTIEADNDDERYHLSCNEFTLNARGHRLYLLKRLTQELNRQEVATWKKVIRLIGHELNNSLAPISSLAHSAQLLMARDDTERVVELLGTIETRSAHLKRFIEGYSRFAKLPDPQRREIEWDPFFTRLSALHPFDYRPDAPGSSGFADPDQLEQVIINLSKNAVESGSDPERITIRVVGSNTGSLITVADRGPGMNDEALTNALLPFYSTKRTGSGLGLSLCREIVDAHGGRITLRNRREGGLAVSLWLPAAGAAAQPVSAGSAVA
ncbi:MAG: ATP-binding protein [Pseudomonadota bacterium]